MLGGIDIGPQSTLPTASPQSIQSGMVVASDSSGTTGPSTDHMVGRSEVPAPPTGEILYSLAHTCITTTYDGEVHRFVRLS